MRQSAVIGQEEAETALQRGAGPTDMFADGGGLRGCDGSISGCHKAARWSIIWKIFLHFSLCFHLNHS